MPLDVIAVPRSRGIVLAAVLPPGAQNTKPGVLDLVAEDGSRFRFPAANAVLRVAVEDGRDGEDPGGRVAALRERLTPFTEWLAVHGTFEKGRRVTIPEIADALGLTGRDAQLEIALGIPESAPWLRRDGEGLVIVSAREALEQLFHMSDGRFRARGDALVAEWWPRRAAGCPDGWVDAAGPLGARARIALERANFFDPDYVPSDDVAAAAAVAALLAWATEGELAADARGRDLAKRLGLPDDADHVLEELVECGATPSDTDPSEARAGLGAPFAADVREQVESILRAPPGGAGREDLTGIFAVAVDDAGTREVDDALSLRRAGDDWELLVHVADVAGAIAPGSPLDAIASARATSMFLPDRSVLMLPEDLVAQRLSLAVNEARCALTGIFRMTAAGEVKGARFVTSLVRLDRRVTYAETRDSAVLAETAELGARLVALAAALRAARAEAGARILDIPSVKVVVEDDIPRVGSRIQDTPGDLAVSEAMVLYNARAGDALVSAGVAGIFRGQDAEARSGRPIPDTDDPLYASRIRRTFAPTQMSAGPLPHAGLAVAAYAQCTSPIRRYADLVNQRQLAAVAGGQTPTWGVTELEALIPQLGLAEKRVRRAADARAGYWMARALERDGRETLRGVLSKAPRRGLGSVWVPDLLKELPLRAPRGWSAPAEGTEAAWRILAIRPFRGRVELAPGE